MVGQPRASKQAIKAYGHLALMNATTCFNSYIVYSKAHPYVAIIV